MNYTAQSVFGVQPASPNYGSVAAPTQQMGTGPIADGWRGLVDPHNPLMWFGVVLLVTFGAAGVAGSVRLGRAKVSADLDRA